jgi:hypothetical protein
MLFTPRTKGLGKENFLRLSDQEECSGLFRGDIYTFKRHWINGRSEECKSVACTICASDPENRPSFRFRVNFVTYKNGQWVAKIFEGGGEIYDLLTNLDRKFNLSSTLIDITRRGTQQNTKYDILPRVDQPITQEMEARIKTIPLLPLAAIPPAQGAA